MGILVVLILSALTGLYLLTPGGGDDNAGDPIDPTIADGQDLSDIDDIGDSEQPGEGQPTDGAPPARDGQPAGDGQRSGEGQSTDGGTGGDGGGNTPGSAGQDTNGDANPPGSSRTTASGQPGSPAAEGTGGERTTTSGRGLYGPDDPTRIPSFAVDARPRDVKVHTVDLDADGQPERVRAWLAANEVNVQVAHFSDGAWEPLDAHQAGLADRLMRLRVADINRDGEPEVYTVQWTATEGESLSLWQYAGPDVEPMPVVGGCWDGQATIGLVGALPRVSQAEAPTLAALCPQDAEPYHQWPADLYTWRNGEWRYSETHGQPS